MGIYWNAYKNQFLDFFLIKNKLYVTEKKHFRPSET
jgi:hypothetical protein